MEENGNQELLPKEVEKGSTKVFGEESRGRVGYLRDHRGERLSMAEKLNTPRGLVGACGWRMVFHNSGDNREPLKNIQLHKTDEKNAQKKPSETSDCSDRKNGQNSCSLNRHRAATRALVSGFLESRFFSRRSAGQTGSATELKVSTSTSLRIAGKKNRGIAGDSRTFRLNSGSEGLAEDFGGGIRTRKKRRGR